MHDSAQYSTTYFTVQVKSPNRKLRQNPSSKREVARPRFVTAYSPHQRRFLRRYNTHATVSGFDCRFNQSAMSEDSPGLMRRFSKNFS